MYEIFISYAHKDGERVGALVKALEALGFSVWLDKRTEVGRRFSSEIESRLTSAKAAIVAWSGASAESTWVLDEAQLARDRDVLLPVLLEPHVLKKIPLEFRNLQAADLHDWQAGIPHEGFDGLCSALRSRTGAAEEDSPLPTLQPSFESFPELLPYLVNRMEQEKLFNKILERALIDGAKRPLVFLLHGEQKECHDSFLQRIEQFTFPRLLARLSKEHAVEWQDLRWPTETVSASDRLKIAEEELNEAFGLPYAATPAHMRASILRHRRPVCLTYYLHVDSWREDERTLLQGWLRYWQCFPDLNPSHPLVLFMSVQFDARRPTKSRAARDASDCLRLLRATRLANIEFNVFPALTPVRREDTEHWVRDMARRYLAFKDVSSLVTDIRNLYANRRLKPSDGISMDELANDLRNILTTRSRGALIGTRSG